MERFGFGHLQAERCINWIKDWFATNGRECNAIVGISGGVDSTVVATLCTKALGENRVIGVLMPNHTQEDINYAKTVVNTLRIRSYTLNIGDAVDGVLKAMEDAHMRISEQTKINLPARIRMSTLYAVSQSNGGRVANTCNLSEDHVGYSTRYGDSVGDFAPIAKFTKSEVIEIGYALGLSDYLMDKEPTDGLCGQTDEQKLGFTYQELDKYIRTGVCENDSVKRKIDVLYRKNVFKQEPMQSFMPRI
jgi:NAD+ synthase